MVYETEPRAMTDKGNMMGKLMRKADRRSWEHLNGLIESLQKAMKQTEQDDW